jgi:hypothetical protein
MFCGEIEMVARMTVGIRIPFQDILVRQSHTSTSELPLIAVIGEVAPNFSRTVTLDSSEFTF